ncbi:MAG TPA: hypothetical protein PL187_16845, partial [Caldilinea sp.]|nr:hypothetical protein [Caldilinea sp.]
RGRAERHDDTCAEIIQQVAQHARNSSTLQQQARYFFTRLWQWDQVVFDAADASGEKNERSLT